MRRATQVGVLGGVAALALAGVGYGETGNTTDIDELQARLARAEAMIADLKAQEGDEWLTEARADEIRVLVYDVLADADTRASLLQGGGTAGYDNGFRISSTDGNFLLKINGLVQARWMVNSRDDGPAAAFTGAPFLDDDTTRSGFEATTARLGFSGHVVNPQWTYNIQMDMGDAVGGRLLDGWINYDYGNGWWSQIGQYTSPFMRESLVDTGYQQAVSRSLVEYAFNSGSLAAFGVATGASPAFGFGASAVEERTQGIMMGYNSDNWRVSFNYNDGMASGNSIALDGPNGPTGPAGATEYAFGGRFEYMCMGNWAQFDDFTSPMGEEEGILVGFAIHTEKSEYGEDITFTAGTPEVESLSITADLSWEFGGANIFAAFVYNNLDDDTSGPGGIDQDRYGFVVQGGYYLAEDFELYARGEWVDLDNNSLSEDSISILTFGFNKYFSSHNMKWSTDFGYAFDQLPGEMTGDLSRGWRPDGTDNDGQWNIRTQLQLMF